MDEHQYLASLHNNYALYLQDYLIRMMELELYSADDPFTHGNELQKQELGFYIHRSGKTASSKYKGGSFGGIDLVINGIGFLIRSIEVYKIYGEALIQESLIEGPNLTLNKLSDLSGWQFEDLEKNLQLIQYKWNPIQPIYGARGGLTLKKSNDIQSWSQYLILPRRSAIFQPKKYKETWFVVDINRKDIQCRSIKKYQEEFNDQASKNDLLLNSRSTPLQCAGYWSIK